jgi:(2Fe-2S) ferredoxin
VPEVSPRAIIVCVNRRQGHDKPSCAGRGGEAIACALEEAGARVGVCVTRLKCFGRCAEGPNVRLHGGRFFRRTTLADVPSIIAAALEPDPSRP